MTKPKAKYSYFDWLLFTQVVEIFQTTPKSMRRAEELCDLINAAIEYIHVSGFDPVEVFKKRCGEGGDKTPVKIARAYNRQWLKLARKIQEMEEAGR